LILLLAFCQEVCDVPHHVYAQITDIVVLLVHGIELDNLQDLHDADEVQIHKVIINDEFYAFEGLKS